MEAGAVLYAGGGSKGSSSDLALSGVSGKNAQTKSRQCRGKEEESDTACCIGTPEHCGLVRRDLVVCPPFWLLPRIETGDSFLWACGAPLLRPHPQGNVPAWALRGEPFGGYGGMSVPFSLNAPLLCQTIVAILCGNFEQFANIAVCVYNVRATSANCISQICRVDRALFLKIAIKRMTIRSA